MRRFSVSCMLLFTVSLMLAACGTAAQGPMTWLDRPLDGAVLPLAPVTIQAHASDADGVASFQFFVDDAPLVTASAEGGRLGTAMVEWNPTTPGTYTIRAQGVDAQGNAGSNAISIITVGEMPQASPTVPSPPEPGPPGPAGEVSIDFTADRTNLLRGECAVLLWTVEGGEVAHLNGEPVPPSGEREVCPDVTSSFTLAVYVGVGPPSPPVAERELVITVGEPQAITPSPTHAAPSATALRPTATGVPPTSTPIPPVSTPTTPPPPPTIVSFQANPASITEGQTTTVSWAVEGVISAVYLDGEGVGDHDSRPRQPEQTTTYTLRAVGPGGETTRDVTVTVTHPQPTQTQPFSADLAITDLRAVPPSHEVLGDITNHGPGTVSNVTVQLSCQWDEYDTIENVHHTGQLPSMPILISNLSPGHTQVFNTDIMVNPGLYEVDFSCTIQVPFNDPNLGNNTHSEQGW
ncbi:MAG: Ig-like domain-containing protein [Anaerolineae bacterium]|nr:Ig-like domain-containing protein [Anaerolineae bacterium]